MHIDSAAHIIQVIWPLANVAVGSASARGLLLVKTFMQETFRRSRTSYTTLQAALYYLVSIEHRHPATSLAPGESAST
ncbi:MAG: hypothetical protein M1826_003498 [Phylliscum demangeonii]|nr:MAG: hypothetical protein M1826_003498 [Phylliscum demangeonii]